MVDFVDKEKTFQISKQLIGWLQPPAFDHHGWQVSLLTDSLQSPPYPTGIILAA